MLSHLHPEPTGASEDRGEGRQHALRYLVGLIAIALCAVTPSRAQTVGTCEPGQATVNLEGNNVRARLSNTGGFQWKSGVYRVPGDGQAGAISASDIWVGGVDSHGEIRFSGTAYGPYEYWPGPLDADGNPAADCTFYDRIYTVSRSDLEVLDAGGAATSDISDWPYELGAPVRDGDGILDNYDLQNGDRPGLIGDQTAWWVMNDAGNRKTFSYSEPIGLEVQVTAFAFHTSDALDNTTFYRYRLINKGSQTLEQTYVGIWSDPDLGNYADDFVGADTTLDLAFVYNGDIDDEGEHGYGVPPAIGYKIIQGALVPDPDGGVWVDPDGAVHAGMKRVGITNLMCYWCWGGIDYTPGGTSWQRGYLYNLLRSVWLDGMHLTYGGSGYGRLVATNIVFPGDPVTHSYWSEKNIYGDGLSATPDERRLVLSTGPFDFGPGDEQEIIVAIVWAQGADYLDSILALREAACVAHNRIDNRHPCGYVRPDIPAPLPVRTVAPADGVAGQPSVVTFAWEEDPDPYFIGYDLEVASDPDFGNPVSVSTEVGETTVTLETDAQYWWRVRRNNVGIQGPWSDVQRFATGYVSVLPSGGLTAMLTVSNATGPLDPPEPGAFAYAGFPTLDGADVPSDRQQVGDGIWGMHTGEGNGAWFDDFVASSFRNGWSDIIPYDWEIRFTSRCYGAWEVSQASGNPYGSFPGDACYAYDRFGYVSADANSPVIVPFEVWSIGSDTPHDPSDDFRMIPAGLDWDGDGWNLQCWDHEVSPGANDPVTDWIYTFLPEGDDKSPGEAGYDAWRDGILADTANADHHGREVMARLVFVNLDGGDVSNCDPRPTFMAEMPEAGTVFRIVTAKPIVPILASPGPGETLPTGRRRFFWTALAVDPVRLEVRTDSGAEWSFDNAATGMEVDLPSAGTYQWRAVSLWSGASEWWGFDVVSGVNTDSRDELPESVELSQNYPNPFNPSTTIRFGLPQAAAVTLEVYDITGRRILSMLSGARYPAGYHEVVMRSGRLASGVYLYRLTTAGVSRTGKMVLFR